MLCGVEGPSPSEDQGVSLAIAMTAPDDEVHAAVHGPGRSNGMPIVRQGSGGLSTLILCLPLSPNGMTGNGGRPSCDDLRGGILAVSRRRYISSRS